MPPVSGITARANSARRRLTRSRTLRSTSTAARVFRLGNYGDRLDCACRATLPYGSSGPAADVVAEIEAAGGIATADTNSVATSEGGAAIVQTAVDAYGRVDVVIGTHRLLQQNVRFRDLGLLVVDEEHRFGVAHKERIKQLRPDETQVLALELIKRGRDLADKGQTADA